VVLFRDLAHVVVLCPQKLHVFILTMTHNMNYTMLAFEVDELSQRWMYNIKE